MRVSVTHLDQLAYFRASEGESWEMPLDELVRRLLGQEPPNPAMLAGSAFHAILEHAKPDDELREVERDGFRFRFEVDGEFPLPQIRELKGTKDFVVDGEIVTLSGQVDAIHGIRVDDHKLTERLDAERYADSWQWRSYLSIFDCDQFRYNVFECYLRERENLRIVHSYHAVPFYRYPELEAETQRRVEDFTRFVRTHCPLYVELRSAA